MIYINYCMLRIGVGNHLLHLSDVLYFEGTEHQEHLFSVSYDIFHTVSSLYRFPHENLLQKTALHTHKQKKCILHCVSGSKLNWTVSNITQYATDYTAIRLAVCESCHCCYSCCTVSEISRPKLQTVFNSQFTRC